ncbi:hypothetical protein TrVE_jg5427 [Triparma verrucosa]|uniref:Uncharacterized protein n=1 Tax=Triparma verrucosa TaxID=1606542 RepID=A0A9W7F7M5_9STRA|nr:hypothetical protein TrVE_jg5427 [Triparma verrucosa]
MLPSKDLSTLPSLIQTTTASLDVIWSQVGYSDIEKSAQLTSLMTLIQEMCSSKISEENAVMEQFRHAIDETRKEIIETSNALHREVQDGVLEEKGEGVTLTETLGSLTDVAEGLRKEAQGAREKIKTARATIQNSHAALGTEVPDQFSPSAVEDLSDTVVTAFEIHAKDMSDKVNTRVGVVKGLVEDCQNLIKELQIESETTELDRKVMGSLTIKKDGCTSLTSMVSGETSVGIGGAALEDLTGRVGDLTAEKRRRKGKLGSLGAEIAALWEKLKVPEDVQRHFTESVQGLGMDTIMKGEMEVKRLNQLKTDMRGKLIEEARETIIGLWDETNASQQQRDAFKGLNVREESEFTDELLQSHDEEIDVLRARLDQMRPMLKMIERREEVVLERTQYEELQKDPERLKQRGGALTKQLMMEEKMQKRIKKDLPKYNETLTKKLKEWKQMTGEDFMYQGLPYITIMERQESSWSAYKDSQSQKKLAKKQQEKARYSGAGGKLKLMTKRKGKPLGNNNTIGKA